MKMISKWAVSAVIGLSCLAMTARATSFDLSTNSTGVSESHNVTVPAGSTFYSYTQAWGATVWDDFNHTYLYSSSTGFSGVFGPPSGTVYSFSVNSGAQPGGYADDWRSAGNVGAGTYTVVFGGGCGQVGGSTGHLVFHTEVTW